MANVPTVILALATVVTEPIAEVDASPTVIALALATVVTEPIAEVIARVPRVTDTEVAPQ
jgi:hypothetical protein